ncbi:MAG: ABC transporter permease [Actinomycetes bacterium]
MGLWEYVLSRRDELIIEATQHASLVAQSMIIATIIGVGVAVLAYHNASVSRAALTASSVMLTIPSFALLGLLITPLGLGVAPTMVALVMYALLPIVRNAIVGLLSVDSAIVDSARGMGMSRLSTLTRVEIPLAWPVILTGIRVSTQMIMGIAAIAAYVAGPGLGNSIFSGLSRFGSANSVNSALAGTLGVILLALLFDLGYLLIGRLTTSRGLRV